MLVIEEDGYYKVSVDGDSSYWVAIGDLKIVYGGTPEVVKLEAGKYTVSSDSWFADAISFSFVIEETEAPEEPEVPETPTGSTLEIGENKNLSSDMATYYFTVTESGDYSIVLTGNVGTVFLRDDNGLLTMGSSTSIDNTYTVKITYSLSANVRYNVMIFSYDGTQNQVCDLTISAE